jgi:Fibronectin type III domain
VIKTLFSNLIILLVLCFFLSPTNSFAGQATLAWDPPDISTDVTGYMINYGTASGTYSQVIDVGNTTSYTVSNLIDGQTYYFAVTSYDALGNQSVCSNEVSMLTATDTNTTAGSGGGGGGCFIATAAFGSYLDPHVKVLRDFRDRYLLTNSLGQAFVNYYYRYSPPIADVIREHESFKYATRWALVPVVYSVEYPYLMAVLLIIPAGIGLACKRRRKTQQSH